MRAGLGTNDFRHATGCPCTYVFRTAAEIDEENRASNKTFFVAKTPQQQQPRFNGRHGQARGCTGRHAGQPFRASILLVGVFLYQRTWYLVLYCALCCLACRLVANLCPSVFVLFIQKGPMEGSHIPTQQGHQYEVRSSYAARLSCSNWV